MLQIVKIFKQILTVIIGFHSDYLNSREVV